MAAGQGFKTFTSGEVLTAADVNGYLMQGVGVFADAANRDAEITSPQEGQFAYLSDTNVTTYYTGSVWANLDTTGMTNPMTTTGDVIYSSSGSTPDRLGIGTAGQVLQVNSGATAPEWATPAGGGGASYTLLSDANTTSGSTYTVTGLGGYNSLFIVVQTVNPVTAGLQLVARFNTLTTSIYDRFYPYIQAGASYAPVNFGATGTIGATSFHVGSFSSNTSSQMSGYIQITGANTVEKKMVTHAFGSSAAGGNGQVQVVGAGVLNTAALITSFSLINSGTFAGGRVQIYGSVI
jgi:hypothetical protein